jgi:hypothetical protein
MMPRRLPKPLRSRHQEPRRLSPLRAAMHRSARAAMQLCKREPCSGATPETFQKEGAAISFGLEHYTFGPSWPSWLNINYSPNVVRLDCV